MSWWENSIGWSCDCWTLEGTRDDGNYIKFKFKIHFSGQRFISKIHFTYTKNKNQHENTTKVCPHSSIDNFLLQNFQLQYEQLTFQMNPLLLLTSFFILAIKKLFKWSINTLYWEEKHCFAWSQRSDNMVWCHFVKTKYAFAF